MKPTNTLNIVNQMQNVHLILMIGQSQFYGYGNLRKNKLSSHHPYASYMCLIDYRTVGRKIVCERWLLRYISISNYPYVVYYNFQQVTFLVFFSKEFIYTQIPVPLD